MCAEQLCMVYLTVICIHFGLDNYCVMFMCSLSWGEGIDYAGSCGSPPLFIEGEYSF